MEPITYEAVQRDPQLLQALIERAHQARAETVHRLIVQPIKALFTGPPQPRLLRPARRTGACS